MSILGGRRARPREFRSPDPHLTHYNSEVGRETLETLFDSYLRLRDEAAVRELVARTRPRMLAIARRIGRPQDAEDTVQTAYLSLMHKRAGEFDAPVLAWLVTATVRIAYGAKAKARRLATLAERLSHPPPAPASDERAAAAEEARELRRRVDALPAPMRDSVVLRSARPGRHRLVIDATADPVERELEVVLGRTNRIRLD